MNRRLYFLLPDRSHALSVVDELAHSDIDSLHLHALADQRTRLDGLPGATRRQYQDSATRLEKILWNANLISFACALSALIALLITLGLSWWLVIPIGTLVVNFVIGLHFSSIPNTHLGEFRDALAHGEILLLVDVPESRVAEVENQVHRGHPEAIPGGVGWGTQAFGL
jgi:hypothetical protein